MPGVTPNQSWPYPYNSEAAQRAALANLALAQDASLLTLDTALATARNRAQVALTGSQGSVAVTTETILTITAEVTDTAGIATVASAGFTPTTGTNTTGAWLVRVETTLVGAVVTASFRLSIFIAGVLYARRFWLSPGARPVGFTALVPVTNGQLVTARYWASNNTITGGLANTRFTASQIARP